MLLAKTLYVFFSQLSVRVLVSMEHVQNQILVHVTQASMELYVTEVSILQFSQSSSSFKIIDLTS